MFYTNNKPFHKLVLFKSVGDRENVSGGSVRKIQSVQLLELVLYNTPSK